MKFETKNHYSLFEASSALQKEIRRGNEECAMYWALELAETYDGYLWERLTIIANEDIGLADPQVIVLTETLRQQFNQVRKKEAASWRIILANAIISLCRAQKTRLADSFMAVISHRRDTLAWRLEVPDYALDKHTRRGKTLGRSWEHWAREGCKLKNERKGMDSYAEEALSLRKRYGKLNQSRPGTPRRRRRGDCPEIVQ
jgi:replication-associated recombination protein RarA